MASRGAVGPRPSVVRQTASPRLALCRRKRPDGLAAPVDALVALEHLIDLCLGRRARHEAVTFCRVRTLRFMRPIRTRARSGSRSPRPRRRLPVITTSARRVLDLGDSAIDKTSSIRFSRADRACGK